MNTELSVIPDSKELVRQSTDIAGLCKAIVTASVSLIEGKKYVRVEGWQAIATAHGCVASARDVRKVEGGMVATGEIRRMQDGQLIATAEGFVGEDEPTWYGGETEKAEWKNGSKTGKTIKKTLPKRAEYAIRAMAQTRAISRACRGCFAHVVVLMNAGLSTTPAEEVPDGGFNDNHNSIDLTPDPEPKPGLTEADELKKRVKGRSKSIADTCPQQIQPTTWMGQYLTELSLALKIDPVKTTLLDFTLPELREAAQHHDSIVKTLLEQIQP